MASDIRFKNRIGKTVSDFAMSHDTVEITFTDGSKVTISANEASGLSVTVAPPFRLPQGAFIRSRILQGVESDEPERIIEQAVSVSDYHQAPRAIDYSVSSGLHNQ